MSTLTVAPARLRPVAVWGLQGLLGVALAAQMVGAAATQVAFVDDGSPLLPIVLGVLAMAVAWLRRDRSVETVLRVRSRVLHSSP